MDLTIRVNTGGLKESILRTRNKATFHYDSETVKEALDRWLVDHGANEEAYIIFQEKSRLFWKRSYYSIADMVSAEIAFGIGNSNHQKDLNGAIELMRSLDRFTDCLFIAYVKNRKLDQFIRPYTANVKV